MSANEAPRPPEDNAPAEPPVVVKKYANRRLYDTEGSSYVTLEDLANMVRRGRDFVVYDAKSGDDITRSVLTQIIVEEESKGRNMLPVPFLRQLIGLYGDSLQSLVPRYLEMSMGAFARQQEDLRKSLQGAMQGAMGVGLAGNMAKNFNPLAPFSGAPFAGFEEMNRQNMAMMERAMSLFSPFPGTAASGAPGPAEAELEGLRAEVRSLRQELSALRDPADQKR